MDKNCKKTPQKICPFRLTRTESKHLMKGNNKPVAIVESEKTAIVASIYIPEYVWIATGGKNGCKWKEKDIAKVLLNREQPIYLFPDLNAIE